MSKNVLELILASIRAAYGDLTGLGSLAVKKSPHIFKIVAIFLIFILILPTIFIQSLFTGDLKNPNSDFSNLAIQAIADYKEYWIPILTIAQTKKVFSENGQANIIDAANAVKSNSIENYLKSNLETNSNVMELYNLNLQFMTSLLSQYAGYVEFYDEISYPAYCESIRRVYNPTYGFNVLEMIYYTNDIQYKEIIYSSNDVVNFKISDNRLIKIKYRKYTQSAFFPVPATYLYSFSNSFGLPRIHDGNPASHEGIDIFTQRNTPIICVEDSWVEKIGWNSLGGWRILLKSKDGLRKYYYAHMERYIDSLASYMDMSGKVYSNPGISFKAGDTIGFVGSSGSSNTNTPPGADTGTDPHIHFQMWLVTKGWFSEKETLINPYYSLKLLEHNQYSEELKQNKQKLESEGL